MPSNPQPDEPVKGKSIGRNFYDLVSETKAAIDRQEDCLQEISSKLENLIGLSLPLDKDKTIKEEACLLDSCTNLKERSIRIAHILDELAMYLKASL